MKVKLLKKVRKQYKIVYYKKREWLKGVDGIDTHTFFRYTIFKDGKYLTTYLSSKNGCLDFIFNDVKRDIYRKKHILNRGVEVKF